MTNIPSLVTASGCAAMARAWAENINELVRRKGLELFIEDVVFIGVAAMVYLDKDVCRFDGDSILLVSASHMLVVEFVPGYGFFPVLDVK